MDSSEVAGGSDASDAAEADALEDELHWDTTARTRGYCDCGDEAVSRTVVKETEHKDRTFLFCPTDKCGLRSTGFARLSWRMRSSSIVSDPNIH